MAEMILPGVYIEVRAEGLIVPGRVTVGNLGVLGTASNGPVGVPVIVGSYTEARERFGDFDAWGGGTNNELTLVRALELAFGHGATTVFALRVSSLAANQGAATYLLSSPGGDNVTLTAKNPGTWGNDLQVNVTAADQDAFVENETITDDGPFKLAFPPVVASARNRVRRRIAATGETRSLGIIYDDDPAAPGPNQVKINRADGVITFGTPLDDDDILTVSYVVDRASARKVTLRYRQSQEVYTIVSGDDLVSEINRSPGGSALVTAVAETNAGQLPDSSAGPNAFSNFGTGTNTPGANGEDADAGDYQVALNLLLNEPVHIVVAAGQDDSFGDELNAHVQSASTDTIKGDRIAVVGSRLGATVDDLRGHTLDSDRLIFVAPGVKVTDTGLRPDGTISGDEVTLPGAYAAAAVAGLLAGLSPHVSLTNKVVSIGGLERRFTAAELTQLVQSRVFALEQRQGFRVVKGITTSTNSAFAQITTRRIVDFAKYGVRSAATPFIGRLNNERVRTALHGTVNLFLGEMVNDEMLVSYELEVTATREEERQGIVRVNMVLRPVFSIDFIKVTMFLE
ncbi:MAG TPA: phage tail sheath C-terminal domain-containing protein [Pyrinomonadaceae bacterium]|nr:phage tail sheath C-terminal domain-containing protein [Pyrinomonadaceae bacterium]